MTNDLIEKSAPPVEIALEEIAIKIDAHGKAAIENILTVGKLLCEAREMLPSNNEFGDWREKRLPWITKKLSERWMNVYRNGGENLLRHNVVTTVLYELTAPSVPESAREAAAKEETLTVKQAKELAAAHRRIQELESPRKPDLDNLIPGLMKKYKGASITIGTANRLSCLDEEQQNAFLSILESKMFEENQNRRLADEKLKALENLAKAIRDCLSYNKRINKISQAELKDAFPDMFQALLPFIHGIQIGEIALQNKAKVEDAARLVGSYFAGNTAAIGLAENLKQIEHK